MSEVFLLCSKCFKDHGLSLQASFIGMEMNDLSCNNCKCHGGYHLNAEGLCILSQTFFVNGTTHKCKYGEAPLLQFNEHQKNSITVSTELQHDIDLISDKTGFVFFLYGPRLWMLGEVTPLKELQSKKTRNNIIRRIFDSYPKVTLGAMDMFYRVRKKPKEPDNPNEYDSPPITMPNRLNSKHFPTLYASQDIETCIHECRLTVEDQIYIATLVPKGNTSLLDLSILLKDGCNEFESLDMSIHMLFLTGNYAQKVHTFRSESASVP